MKIKTSAQVHNPNEPITVTNFYPDSGGIATQVILNGENFGTDLENIEVYFNNKKAALVGSLGNKLYVITRAVRATVCRMTVIRITIRWKSPLKVGEQSAVYDKKFDYHIQTVVTTLCGRPGTSGVKVGTLGETEFPEVGFLAIDAEDNLFVCPRELWGSQQTDSDQ